MESAPGVRKNAVETQSKFARRYGAEFKQNAVALVQAGLSISEVFHNLGCSSWSHRRWVAVAKHGGSQTQPKTLAVDSPEQQGEPPLAP